MGITTIFLIGYIVVIGVFGKTDISGFLPMKLAASIQRVWWTMAPPLTVTQTTTADGKKETDYRVPTRQLTPQELAQLKSNKTTTPASAAKPSPTSPPPAR